MNAPPGEERRPATSEPGDDLPPQSPSQKLKRSVTFADDTSEVAQRKGGIARHTHRRAVNCVCLACGDTFPNTGTAASHSRSTRHTVACHYFAAFTFVANEQGGVL